MDNDILGDNTMKNRSIGILVILFMIISIVYTGTIPIIAEEINEQKDSLVLENAPNHIRELIEKNISERRDIAK